MTSLTTRKRLIAVTCLVAFVSVVLGVIAFLPPRPGVSKANFDRIINGMTRAEVEAILGKTPTGNGLNPQSATWWDNGEFVLVQFDERDQVALTRWGNDGRNFLQKLWDCRPWRQLPPPTFQS